MTGANWAEPASESDLVRLHDDLQSEYAQAVSTITAFDQRLLTIKGWGVSLSLASLGLAFQQNHYGLFLVAAISSVAFWLVEATTKTHQMRFYPRMRDIEVIAYELFGVGRGDERVSSPLRDWGWNTAMYRLGSPKSPADPQPSFSEPRPRPDVGKHRPAPSWLFPHVMLPHIVTALTGAVLFVLGLTGVLGPI